MHACSGRFTIQNISTVSRIYIIYITLLSTVAIVYRCRVPFYCTPSIAMVKLDKYINDTVPSTSYSRRYIVYTSHANGTALILVMVTITVVVGVYLYYESPCQTPVSTDSCSCYWLTSSASFAADAEDMCRGDNGTLAVVNSQAVTDFVQDRLLA